MTVARDSRTAGEAPSGTKQEPAACNRGGTCGDEGARSVQWACSSIASSPPRSHVGLLLAVRRPRLARGLAIRPLRCLACGGSRQAIAQAEWMAREQLRWTWQRPARRATGRNEEVIYQRGQRPLGRRLKRARRQHALIVFEDESGVSPRRSVGGTWAPGGVYARAAARVQRKRLSVEGRSWPASGWQDAHLILQLRPGAYNDERLMIPLRVPCA
jgi:hypothetical protein